MFRYWLVILYCSLAIFARASLSAQTDPARFVSKQIKITGSVEHPITLNEKDLIALPQVSISEIQMICQSGANKGKKTGLSGVRLSDVLELAQLHADHHFDFRHMAIIAKANDDYWVVYSWGEVFNSKAGDEIYVYFAKDGLPLDDHEGHFALISANDIRTGIRHVKWLSELEVRKLSK